jgi:hypothetical protein
MDQGVLITRDFWIESENNFRLHKMQMIIKDRVTNIESLYRSSQDLLPSEVNSTFSVGEQTDLSTNLIITKYVLNKPVVANVGDPKSLDIKAGKKISDLVEKKTKYWDGNSVVDEFVEPLLPEDIAPTPTDNKPLWAVALVIVAVIAFVGLRRFKNMTR